MEEYAKDIKQIEKKEVVTHQTDRKETALMRNFSYL